MKAIAVFLLFVGMFLVVQGYYQASYRRKAETEQKVQIKYIPRSLYDEQMAEKPVITKQFQGMFEDVHPWPTMRG